MTTRVLPREEWPKLAHTELGGQALPDATLVLVVEEADAIIGCWAILPIHHAEGLWIAPAHRMKTAVARHLWRGMIDLARCLGLTALLTGAGDANIEAMLRKRHAVPTPVPLFLLPVRRM